MKTKNIRESLVENWFRKACNVNNFLCWKFTSPSLNGVPDRIVLMPNAKIAFVELKAPGKKPTKLQAHCHSILRKLGFPVFVIDGKEGIEKFITWAKTKRRFYDAEIED